ncbi:hypothetical protein OSB04_017042 [Centaurea solstitialis]|uniref:Uncharacterized protein n=1 Tax=Centaurea solstitialis TaxID=347529 RepID=A0AA38W939_9ASTR|nr:hypothetical protein OSB04_017042 [Centaurea solstitialis]
MVSFSLSEDEECRFFDAQDTIPDPFSETEEPTSHSHMVPDDFQYHIWANAPISVHQRKNSFLRFMGLSSDAKIFQENKIDDDDDDGLLNKGSQDRIMQSSGAELRIPLQQDSFTSSTVSRNQDSNGSCLTSSTVSRNQDSNGSLPSTVSRNQDSNGSLTSSTVSRNQDSNGSCLTSSTVSRNQDSNGSCLTSSTVSRNQDSNGSCLTSSTVSRNQDSNGSLPSTVSRNQDSNGSLTSSTVSRNQDSNGSTNSQEEEEEEEDGGKLSKPLEVVSSPSVQKLVDRHIKVADTMARTMNKVKGRFLCRLRSMACIVHKEGRSEGFGSPDVGSRPWAKVQRVRVRHNRKRLKELSAVFVGQDIQAHQGSILTMKFSLDGRYLASAGEDAVVRVWQVVEDERSNDIDIPDVDPSCLYFTVNSLAELAPLMVAKQKISTLKSLRKTKDSACVIFPPKVFRILEKPVHEFHGHKGEVLDLSWSRDNLLLSSSVDETVRLWRVGSDHCVKVFPHSNYVTCVQFQPVNEDYFISGSIDGKVRTWSISGCHVVDWIDVREIVTAVAYSPNGKGGVIGSMTGCCSFFSLSDNRFQLEASVSLNSKKKLPFRRIIGFQFCPQDSDKIMVTCADSHVRILHGTNVIAKFRGQRNAGNPLSAAFTADGKHIVSASEDSNVYVWNCNDQKGSSIFQQKTVRSYECFSAGASVALPWSGLKVRKSTGNGWEFEEGLSKPLPFSSPSYFSLDQDYFPDSTSKVSATWPEEKLPSSSSSLAYRLHCVNLDTNSSDLLARARMVAIHGAW